jgi:hypothetical protein
MTLNGLLIFALEMPRCYFEKKVQKLKLFFGSAPDVL